MPKPKVYLETTVVSYLLARPSTDPIARYRQKITREWWDRYVPKVELITSSAVMKEAAMGDAGAAAQRLNLLQPLKMLDLDDVTEDLAKWYIEIGLVPAKSAEDAVHIAFATTYAFDAICTWNMKHIANLDIQLRLRKLNQARGLNTPLMCTPDAMFWETL